MMEPALFDIVELLIDLPEHGLRAGARGTIVHQYVDEAYEVEFVSESGETIALCTLSPRQFIVVWRAETQQWVPVEELVTQVVARLPEETGSEVLDFARFLLARTSNAHLAHATGD